MKSFYFLVFVFLYISMAYAQPCNSTSLITQQIRAKDTDSNIDWELNKHFTFFNPSCTSRGILVVHFVGSYDNPSSNLLFPSYAANNGYHVISIKYENSTAAQSACTGNTDMDCYGDFRKEIIEGGDHSSDVDVDIANSAINRILKLLQFLNSSNPSEGWDLYYTNDEINWGEIIVSGHSQGGGHAAYVGKHHKVKRVLMFASPNDFSAYYSAPASWTSQSSLTADSLYYGLNNLVDDVVDFSDQFLIWNNLGMPTYGDTLNVDQTSNYFPSHQLYTQKTGPGTNQNHSLMIRDDQTLLDINGKSIFIPVWEYMLGISYGLTIENNTQSEILKVYPNPVNSILFIDGDLSTSELSIFNSIGQKMSIQFTSSQNLDVSNLESGIYFIHIQKENSILKFKFIKH